MFSLWWVIRKFHHLSPLGCSSEQLESLPSSKLGKKIGSSNHYHFYKILDSLGGRSESFLTFYFHFHHLPLLLDGFQMIGHVGNMVRLLFYHSNLIETSIISPFDWKSNSELVIRLYFHHLNVMWTLIIPPFDWKSNSGLVVHRIEDDCLEPLMDSGVFRVSSTMMLQTTSLWEGYNWWGGCETYCM